jgi:hypothetical protein
LVFFNKKNFLSMISVTNIQNNLFFKGSIC